LASQAAVQRASGPVEIARENQVKQVIVLAFQFNNLRLPFVIYLAAPFALAGMGYGLALAGMPFSATVIIRVMIVLAANVTDGVLLIQTAEDLRAQGMPLHEATRTAAIQRMRPRLMTTLPIILGFVPLAFAFQSGGELLRPMATAVIGGLSIEVLAALFLVPVLYTWLARKEGAQT